MVLVDQTQHTEPEGLNPTMPDSVHIARATNSEQIDACFPVMAQLRPHLHRPAFVALVERLRASTGFQLVYLEHDGVKAVAGYRVSEWLAGGRYLEIEDLVASDAARSKGYGGLLFDWLVGVAKSEACDHIRLVSRLHRKAAHRFYERKGMTAEAYYFSMNMAARETASGT
jgi:GNAT superfamily N-acetyltransferase